MPNAKKTIAGKTAGKKASAAAIPPLVLKRETVADLHALLKQTSRARQSRKVCIA